MAEKRSESSGTSTGKKAGTSKKTSSKKSSSAGKSGAGSKTTGSKQSARAPRAEAARKPGAREVAEAAARQLAELTSQEVEAVTGLQRNDDGWEVDVQVLELRRVPSTTDVLGSYRVELDRDGELMGYRRRQRYVRGTPGEEGP